MFKRSEERRMKSGSGQSQGRLNSILGDSSQMNGSMHIQGSVRIDGEFEGALVATETIVVGRAGKARADLKAREITVAGHAEGKLIASERVELQEGAHVEGDVFANSFVIADGVFFNGTCAMGDEAREEITAGSAARAGRRGTGAAADGRVEPGTEGAPMHVVESR